jgi:capsular polysaccharide biosynthesis protein
MMKVEDEIIVSISKFKLTLMLIGSLVFVALGIIYIIDQNSLVNPLFRSKELILVVGIASVLFFGLASFYLFKKLFDNRPGLIISIHGIYDNSSATPVGLIEWKDIVNTDVIKIHGQRIILIKVKNQISIL